MLQVQQSRWTVVGAGPCGIGSVGRLLDYGTQVTWVDPKFEEGRMGNYYKNVPSNTLNGDLIAGLNVSPALRFRDVDVMRRTTPEKMVMSDLDFNTCYDLGVFVNTLSDVRELIMKSTTILKGEATEIIFDSVAQCWNVCTKIGDEMFWHTADVVLYCGGSRPIILHELSMTEEQRRSPCVEMSNIVFHNLDYMVDPKHCSELLSIDDAHYMRDTKWAVVGNSHSAMLVMMNLYEAGARNIVNFHRSDLRFMHDTEEGWRRIWNPGNRESCAVAKRLARGDPPTLASFILFIPLILRILCAMMSFQFERDFISAPGVKFAADNWPLAIAIVIIYLMGIQIGTAQMSKCAKPFDLKYQLAAWNAFLCIFSFIGMCKTVPTLLHMITTMPYEQTVCGEGASTWGAGPSGFWVMLFIYSKIPELVDTLFIVLRRKPLIFLHWYHHVTVLLFCWSSYSTEAASGLYFVAMNYSVHALMYGYYCLQTLNMVPKWFPTVIITMSQIAQMFVGTGVCASCWYYMYTGRPCFNDIKNLIAGAVMYGSYLYLFCDFAVRRYIFAPKKDKKAAKKVE